MTAFHESNSGEIPEPPEVRIAHEYSLLSVFADSTVRQKDGVKFREWFQLVKEEIHKVRQEWVDSRGKNTFDFAMALEYGNVAAQKIFHRASPTEEQKFFVELLLTIGYQVGKSKDLPVAYKLVHKRLTNLQVLTQWTEPTEGESRLGAINAVINAGVYCKQNLPVINHPEPPTPDVFVDFLGSHDFGKTRGSNILPINTSEENL